MGHSCREARPARSWRWSSVTGSSAWLSTCWSWVSTPNWSGWRWGTRPFTPLCPLPWTKTKVGHAVLFMWKKATHPFTLLCPSPWTKTKVGHAVLFMWEKATHPFTLLCPSPWTKTKVGHAVLFMWKKATHPFMLLCPLLWSSPWTRRVVRCAVCVVYVERGHMPSPCSGHRSRQGKWSGVLCLL